MDTYRVYVPLQNVTALVDEERVVTPRSASLTALDRETGVVHWVSPLESIVPPVPAGDLLLVAAGSEIHALAAATGAPLWRVRLPAPVGAPMLLRGNVLVAFTRPDRLVAVRIDTRAIAWERVIGAGVPLMHADGDAVYASLGSRLTSVLLADGSVRWTRELEGTLSEPAVARDRVLVGSDANALWALSPRSGRDEWMWDGRYFGGDVIGAAVDEDVVYVASLDNIVRALNRGNGNQRWKEEAGTRPAYPPRAFFGTVVVLGLSPAIVTFSAKNGTAISSWTVPADAELQGPPLIDEHLWAFRVAIVVITRDGAVTGLRPTAVMYAEPTAATMTALPGRILPLDRLSPELEYLLQTMPPRPPQLTDPFGMLVTLPGSSLPLEQLPVSPPPALPVR